MNTDDIRRNLLVGPSRAVCLSVEPAISFPGFVRSVYLRDGNRVAVEFEVYGMDEGGAYYEGTYDDLQSAIDALANYLGIPVDRWGDCELNARYPVRDPSANVTLGHESLKSAIRAGTVPLPTGTTFRLKGSTYWTQFEPR